MNGKAIDFVARQSRWFPYLALIAATALAVASYMYEPSRVDGGWYAYPALAISEGRDPGDNQLGVAELLELHEGGTKAKYYWDSRRNLYVWPAALWFEGFGAGFVSTRLLSLSHLLLYLGLAFWVLRRYGGDIRVTGAAWLLLATDSVVISSGIADMRPDLLMSSGALLLFMAFHGAAGEGRGKHLALVAVSSVLLAFAYPLIHLTAPFTMAILWSTVVARYWWEGRTTGARYPSGWVWLALSVTVVAFAFRSQLLDLLIPTQVPEPFAQSALAAVLRNLRAGPMEYALREFNRWASYGYTSNVFILLTMIVGFAIWLYRLIADRRNIPALDRGLLVGVGGAILLVALCSPYPREDHLLSIVPFVLLIACRGISPLVQKQGRAWIVAGVVLIAVATAGSKVLHAAWIAHKASRDHYANRDVREEFAKLVKPGEQTVIVGPAEIWPYLDRRADVVIFDDRAGTEPLDAVVKHAADFLIVSRDYLKYGWPEKFLARNHGVHVLLQAQFGTVEKGPYLAIYRFVHEGDESSRGE